MTSSIRYGPTPPDLTVGKPPKTTYGMYVAQTFIPVRARVGGAWRLGVVREWIGAGSRGWLVRIETVDTASKVGLHSEWYVFRADAIDRLRIEATSGEVRLVSPDAADPQAGGRRGNR